MTTKIHIIEDDIDLSDTYREALEFEGYEVAVDHTGSSAIDTLSRFRPDFVVLDMYLSGASGGLVLSYIRGHPRLKNSRVIVVSGMEENNQMQGMDVYLRKPVSIQQLCEVISEMEISRNDNIVSA